MPFLNSRGDLKTNNELREYDKSIVKKYIVE